MPRKRRQEGWVELTSTHPRAWTGFYYAYVIVDGKEQRRRRQVPLGKRSELDKGDAEEKLREFIKGLNTPAPASLEPTPQIRLVVLFGDACALYLKLKSGDWGRRNRSVMESLFKCHIIPQLGNRNVSEMLQTDIKAWINDLAATECYDIVRKALTHVRAVFEMLLDDDLIRRNPARKVKPPKTRKRSGYFLSLPDVYRLLKTAPEGRDNIILRMQLCFGLRPSEMFALQVKDIEPTRIRIDEAVVEGEVKSTKTEESDGYVPLPPQLAADLNAYLLRSGITEPEQYLFPSEVGTPFGTHNYLNRHLKPLAEKAKVKGVDFRSLRRTCGTHFANHGKVKDAQALLRHADATTTLKHYQKTIPESLTAAVASWENQLMTEVIQ